MKVILCLDDRGGMMFNHRRQSRDREVIGDILDMVGDGVLWMAPYSRMLFSESAPALRVEEDFLNLAEASDWCFVEDRALLPYEDRIEEMVFYRWNRRYPYDMKLDMEPLSHGFSLLDTVEFAGFSHEKITKEIYRK